MRIRRLGWAGLELEADGQTAVVDLLQDTTWLEGFVGAPRTPLPRPSRPADLALVTHLHADHTDAGSLKRALKPGAPVLRPAPATGEALENAALEPAETGLREAGLHARVVEPWETIDIGPFRKSAVPAADGTGDPQVSWVVAAGETTVLHCGDTLFHGWWWRTGMRYGPIDIAFLPVNGVVVDFPHRQPPSGLPAAMTPREAAGAARALGAREAIPMHYDTFHHPPLYDAVEGAADAFVAAAAAAGVSARVVEPGEVVEPAVV
ncbi:MAG: MBL fold metallo-hydrolase [Thermoleophilaceae bacterium]|nr:MBL fold metallo-hydrolase [Thermoleophilaceae bacterium]